MKSKKKKVAKQHGLTLNQLKQYRKASKGAKKSYWSGRITGFKGRVK